MPTLDTYIETYFHDKWGGPLGEDITAYYNAHPPEIYPFGDTVLFIWDLANHPKPDVFLLYFANIASFLMILALDKGIVFRGAMTIGDYIQNENVVIGPAIADAASWYELANMIGIIVTPYCGQFISSICEDIPINPTAYPPNYMAGISLSFRKYNVPLKGGIEESLWTINWPSLNGARMSSKSIALKWYYDCIKRVPIPLGTEEKYRNTESYYRSSCDELESKAFWKHKSVNET